MGSVFVVVVTRYHDRDFVGENAPSVTDRPRVFATRELAETYLASVLMVDVIETLNLHGTLYEDYFADAAQTTLKPEFISFSALVEVDKKLGLFDGDYVPRLVEYNVYEEEVQDERKRVKTAD